MFANVEAGLIVAGVAAIARGAWHIVRELRALRALLLGMPDRLDNHEERITTLEHVRIVPAPRTEITP